jgi:hypothetical protein
MSRVESYRIGIRAVAAREAMTSHAPGIADGGDRYIGHARHLVLIGEPRGDRRLQRSPPPAPAQPLFVFARTRQPAAGKSAPGKTNPIFHRKEMTRQAGRVGKRCEYKPRYGACEHCAI